MLLVPRAHPKEFRDDVVAVARNGDASNSEVAKDFDISESCLRDWLSRAGVENGRRPRVIEKESAELRELRRRNRLLEEENEVLRRAASCLSQANMPGNDGPARP
jgi:transposase